MAAVGEGTPREQREEEEISWSTVFLHREPVGVVVGVGGMGLSRPMNNEAFPALQR